MTPEIQTELEELFALCAEHQKYQVCVSPEAFRVLMDDPQIMNGYRQAMERFKRLADENTA